MSNAPLSRDEWRQRIGNDTLADAELERIIIAIEAGRPTADIDENGIDVSQLRRNRQLPPLQRATRMVKAAHFLNSVKGRAQRSHRTVP